MCKLGPLWSGYKVDYCKIKATQKNKKVKEWGKRPLDLNFKFLQDQSSWMNQSLWMDLYDMKWWLVLFVLSLNPKQLLATGMGGCWWRQNTSIASQMADSSYSLTTFSMSVWAQAIFIRIKKKKKKWSNIAYGIH